jgi:hypothetical protein
VLGTAAALLPSFFAMRAAGERSRDAALPLVPPLVGLLLPKAG